MNSHVDARDKARKNTRRGISLCLLLLPGLALSAGQLEVSKDTVVYADSEDVWSVLSDYCAIAAWHPAIVYCNSDRGNDVGSLRVLTLGNGEQLHEKLTAYSSDDMSYSYYFTKTNLNALPVTDYESTIRVDALGLGRSRVTWRGSFNRGDPSEPPSSELNDQAATGAITSVYEAGLAMIRAIAESMK